MHQCRLLFFDHGTRGMVAWNVFCLWAGIILGRSYWLVMFETNPVKQTRRKPLPCAPARDWLQTFVAGAVAAVSAQGSHNLGAEQHYCKYHLYTWWQNAKAKANQGACVLQATAQVLISDCMFCIAYAVCSFQARRSNVGLGSFVRLKKGPGKLRRGKPFDQLQKGVEGASMCSMSKCHFLKFRARIGLLFPYPSQEPPLAAHMCVLDLGGLPADSCDWV